MWWMYDEDVKCPRCLDALRRSSMQTPNEAHRAVLTYYAILDRGSHYHGVSA